MRLGNRQQWLNRGSCLMPELGPRGHQEVRLWLDLVVRRQEAKCLMKCDVLFIFVLFI